MQWCIFMALLIFVHTLNSNNHGMFALTSQENTDVYLPDLISLT